MVSLIVTVVLLAVILILVVILFLTTFCCIYKYYCHKKQPQKYRYSPLPQPEEDIELEQHGSAHSISCSHSTELCDTELGQISSSLSSLSQDDQQPGDHRFCNETKIQDAELGKQTLYTPCVRYSVELGEQTDTLPATNIVQSSAMGHEGHVALPQSIKTYIADILIPYFMDQRAGNQFAVVLLLSKTDYQNINKVKLSPSDINGKPQVDNSQKALPPCTQYCNYIVARPTIREAIHSEKEIFAIGSYDHSNKSRFDELWEAYCCQHNWVHPEYILVYSWNLPCKDCTDLIIKSLQRSPYNKATIFLAYTSEWKEEGIPERQQNRERLLHQGIIVEEVKYSSYVRKLFAP